MQLNLGSKTTCIKRPFLWLLLENEMPSVGWKKKRKKTNNTESKSKNKHKSMQPPTPPPHLKNSSPPPPHEAITLTEMQADINQLRLRHKHTWRERLKKQLAVSSSATILRCQRLRRTKSVVRSVAWNFMLNRGAYSQPSDTFSCQTQMPQLSSWSQLVRVWVN